MTTFSTLSTDGTRLVYDVVGTGEPLILLHGGGADNSREMWHEHGYVARLKTQFKVIPIDLRGHGDSDKPTNSSAYTIDQMCEDVLAVADACQVERFSLWGYSFGGNIGRFLAARSSRVKQIIIIGIPMGLAVQGEFLKFIKTFKAEWHSITEQYKDDRSIIEQLPHDKAELFKGHNIPVLLSWLQAMLDWGSVEPNQLSCPSLWISGSENESTIRSMTEFANELPQSNLQTHIFEGLTHWQEFAEIDTVYPVMYEFTCQNLGFIQT